MARKRMIDPNFWSSQDVSRLSHFERLILIGLFSNADDYGKGNGKPGYIRSIIFPYEDIPTKKVEIALSNIIKHITIEFYNVNNCEYYRFTNWRKWQAVEKPNPSKIPDPLPDNSATTPRLIHDPLPDNSPANLSQSNLSKVKLIESERDTHARTHEDTENWEKPLSECATIFEEITGKTIPSSLSDQLKFRLLSGIDTELIKEALRLCISKQNSAAYFTSILNNWRVNKITTYEQYLELNTTANCNKTKDKPTTNNIFAQIMQEDKQNE